MSIRAATAAQLKALTRADRANFYMQASAAGAWVWEPNHSLPREPLPPFTAETAAKKVQAAESAWNSRDPAKVALAYSPDTVWRNRDQFLAGRAEVEEFLTAKWEQEREYKLRKHLWSFSGNRIGVRFVYEFVSPEGQWFRCHGNELWEFDPQGYMRWRDMSGNNIPIREDQRILK